MSSCRATNANTKHQEVYLATTYGGRRFVMDFVRWGMSGAQPRFQVVIDGHEAGGGVMRTLAQLAEGDVNAAGRLPILGPKYEASHRKQFTGIGHADAEYIAAASPDVVIALLDECDRLRALLDEACTEWHRLADHRHALLRHVEATAESDEILHDAQTQIASIGTDMGRIAAIRLSLEANGTELSRLDGSGPRLWVDEDELRGFIEGVHADEGGPLCPKLKRILKEQLK